MLRKPRNARTDRLTDWRFFIQIYLVRRSPMHAKYCPQRCFPVHRADDVAVCHEHVVPIHEATGPRLPRCHPRIRQVDGRIQGLFYCPAYPFRLGRPVHLVCAYLLSLSIAC